MLLWRMEAVGRLQGCCLVLLVLLLLVFLVWFWFVCSWDAASARLDLRRLEGCQHCFLVLGLLVFD